MRCVDCLLACLLACLPACLSVCLRAAYLRASVRALVDPALGRAFGPGRSVDRSRGGLLLGRTACDMRRTPIRPCNYRPVPLGLLARAPEKQETELA